MSLSQGVDLQVTNLPMPKLAYSNRVYMSRATFQLLTGSSSSPFAHVGIEGQDLIFMASPLDSGMGDNEIAMNMIQRKSGSFTLSQQLRVRPLDPPASMVVHSVTIGVDLFGKKNAGSKVELDVKQLTESFKTQFSGQVFIANQQLAMDFSGTKLDVIILSFEHINISKSGGSGSGGGVHGQVMHASDCDWQRAPGSQSQIVFTGKEGPERNESLFRSDFNFERMGIGGLDEQFNRMFRTAFASRMFPGLVQQLGINHVRGILLHGPPGCGKTLIARQIGKVLNAREPKIINGPEVLDRYVGGSEEKIRALFADAEKEQSEMGDSSMLHIIIFDEMDAIMKTRGSTSDNTGVSDSIVNQLLSKIDGVDSLNNILVIGMTNRKDMIDEAILRPGRLEIHIEIALPDEHGRTQILNIKTADMRRSNRLSEEVVQRIDELAGRTKNFTGAELEGLVRNAASFALARNVDVSSVSAVDTKSIRVEWADFERALTETVPAFGSKDNAELQSLYKHNGLCNYGGAFEDLWSSLQRLVNQTRQSARTPLLSVLLEGAVSSGKTAVAAKLAAESDFPFVRMISPDTMIGCSESRRCQMLFKVFADSYKSPQSIIFIDDIERIIEYTPVGHRFSNSVLQTLLVLLRKVPPSPSRLLVVATSSIAHLMEDLQLTQAFNVTLHVSLLQSPDEFQSVLMQYGAGDMEPAAIREVASALSKKPIAIKQLLLVLEMTRAEFVADSTDSDMNGAAATTTETRAAGQITANQFLACLHTVGY